MKRSIRTGGLAVLLFCLVPASAQGPGVKSLLGTVVGIQAEAGEISVKLDSGAVSIVKFNRETVFQRVAPGEKSLRNAAAIGLPEIAAGDRVLVSLMPDSPAARRVVVMPAAEIAKRREADREDWTRRGIAGVVAGKKEHEVTLRQRSFRGELTATVTVDEKTTFRRYIPDSVRFADARPSTLAEIQVGDQLRARGRKSDDGLNVKAEEVVFGTFSTRAGSVAVVSPEKQEITVKDLETGKPLVIRLTADSQLKRMPDFGGMPGRMSGGPMGMPGGPGGMPPGSGGEPGGVPRGFGAGAGGPMNGPLGGGPPDFSQMLERLPPARLDSLKPGETIVVSSTRTGNANRVTAIMLLANAESLIQMARRAAGRSRTEDTPGPGMNSLGVGGFMGGNGSLDLPAMLP